MLTEGCVERVRHIIEQDEGESGALRLRVSVDAGGCSGFQYVFELDDELDPEDDRIFSRDGVEVVTDTVSLTFLEGSTIDYKQEMVSSSFRVLENPKSEASCGCGSSFAVKNWAHET